MTSYPDAPFDGHRTYLFSDQGEMYAPEPCLVMDSHRYDMEQCDMVIDEVYGHQDKQFTDRSTTPTS